MVDTCNSHFQFEFIHQQTNNRYIVIMCYSATYVRYSTTSIVDSSTRISMDDGLSQCIAGIDRLLGGGCA